MRRLRGTVALFPILGAVLAPKAVVAQVTPVAGPPRTLVGTWRGTSICRPVGKPACHDETAVYHFRRADTLTVPRADRSGASGGMTERLVLQGNKVVKGVEEEMGTMECSYDPTSGDLLCPMRDWRWVFHAATERGGVTLTGTLRNPAGVIWRDIRVTRSSTAP